MDEWGAMQWREGREEKKKKKKKKKEKEKKKKKEKEDDNDELDLELELESESEEEEEEELDRISLEESEEFWDFSSEMKAKRQSVKDWEKREGERENK